MGSHAIAIMIIAIVGIAIVEFLRQWRGAFSITSLSITDEEWGGISMGDNNPKLEGSGIIDAIPQTGQCPNNCEGCFYNADGFFRTKDIPLLPSLEEVGDKIVRINSGNDSNHLKATVLMSTEKYKKKFFNTSIPNFEFPGPVVFTCNGRHIDKAFLCVTYDIENLMMVRFRSNTWNQELLALAVDEYCFALDIPVTITFMRYESIDMIPRDHQKHYELKRSIKNEYYIMKREMKEKILAQHANIVLNTADVKMCGTLDSSYCRDCGRCKWAFENWKIRIRR